MDNRSKHGIAKNLGARLILSGTILWLAACGQASDPNSGQTSDPARAASGQGEGQGAAPAPSPGTAAKTTALPIEQGIYGDVERGSCSRARRAFFYDGTNYGYFSPAEPGWNDQAYFEVNRIARVGPAARGSDFYEYYRGYTLVWNTENAGAEEDILGIKAEENGRFRSLAVSSGPKGDLFAEETYQKCAFAQLSPQMQATIRAERPQLAGGAAASAPSAPAGFLPIPKGYYAVGTTCNRAANADGASDGPANLAHFDETALTWFDGGPQISGFESLGNSRFRVHARSYGNGDDDKGTKADFVIRVTGASTFVTEPGSFLFDRQQSYTHCPTNSVPKSVRDWFEG